LYLLLLVVAAFVVSDNIRPAQNQSHENDHQPLHGEFKEGHQEEDRPYNGRHVQSSPKQASVRGVDFSRVLDRFEHPLIAAIVPHVVPPPEANEEAPRDILDGPEIESQQQDANHADKDEIGREKATEKVEKNG
jgi:ABC-type nickel/cobalt efflux system permease component RcnA